jgi:uncharacterized SAM-binding protein YcdF (DUF218 family)
MPRSAARLSSMHPSLSRSHAGSGRAMAQARRVRGQATGRAHRGAAGALRALARIAIGGAIVATAALVAPGVILDTPQPAPRTADAIVVISGDEQLARFREGLNLYRNGFGTYLVFSGAAEDNGTSNADVMRRLAVERGVPAQVILEEPRGEDTWGNAVFTREVLETHGLRSAILVTSPYHARRAKLTFDAAYDGSGIRLEVHSAPDSEWRKLSWWQQKETRRLTFTELQKLGYILATGEYHQAPALTTRGE